MGKAFDAGLLEGVSRDWFVNLPVSSVGTINRLEWDQFRRVGRHIRRVLFLLFQGVITVLELVRCTRKGSRNTPRSSECTLKFVNITLCCIWFNCTASEDDVANGVDVRIGSASID